MKRESGKYNFANVCKTASVCLMIFCLAFLTSINFFIYADSGNVTVVADNDFGSEESENDYPPSGPTEEKSAGSGGISVSEEILHELHPEFNFQAVNQLYLHHIAESENIEMFHPELLVPPPRS